MNNKLPNSKEALQERAEQRRLSFTWPFLMVFMRFPLIILGQFLLFIYFIIIGQTAPWGASANMFFFYMPLAADLGCILLLIWLTRREGIGLKDLIGINKNRLGRDIGIGIGLLFLIAVLLYGGLTLSALLIYKSPLPPELPFTPPLWTAWFAVLIFPFTVGIIEELTYRGYALPRLEVITKRRWLALLIMTIGFGSQHIVSPILDWQYSLYFFLPSLPIGLLMGYIYLKQRRLLPLIIAHVGINLMPNMMVLLPKYIPDLLPY